MKALEGNFLLVPTSEISLADGTTRSAPLPQQNGAQGRGGGMHAFSEGEGRQFQVSTDVPLKFSSKLAQFHKGQVMAFFFF